MNNNNSVNNTQRFKQNKNPKYSYYPVMKPGVLALVLLSIANYTTAGGQAGSIIQSNQQNSLNGGLGNPITGSGGNGGAETSAEQSLGGIAGQQNSQAVASGSIIIGEKGEGATPNSGAGGGGDGVATSASLTNDGNVTGGAGGDSGFSAGAGGGGSAVSTSENVVNKGYLIGGAGGNALTGTVANGGGGGAGVYVTRNTQIVTIENSGLIQGGDGGNGKTADITQRGGDGAGAARGASAGHNAQSGSGIIGANLDIRNSGVISSVNTLDGSTGNAITFTSGVNKLLLTPEGEIKGVVQGGGEETLILQGSQNGKAVIGEIEGGQYQAIEHLTIQGGEWLLSGGLSQQDTTLNGGLINIDSPEAFGKGTLYANGGRLGSHKDVMLANDIVTSTGSNSAGLIVESEHSLTLEGDVRGQGGITQNGEGALILAGKNTYAGDTLINKGMLSTMVVNTLSSSSNIVISPGATLNLNNMNQSTGNLVNNSEVNFGDKAGTVLVAQNYQSNGGILNLNTLLAGDDALTDKFIVKGNTQGTTTLVITNRGGEGAPTLNGIKVVEVVGASDGIFNLKGDYLYRDRPALIAGAWSYQLYKNGVTSPDDGSWYLRSSATDVSPTLPAAPVTSTDTSSQTAASGSENAGDSASSTSGKSDGSTAPVTPPPTTAMNQEGAKPADFDAGDAVAKNSGSVKPIWHPGAALYESYAATLSAINQLPALQQRLGNRDWDLTHQEGERAKTGIWGNIHATHGRKGFENATVPGHMSYDLQKVQVGADWQLNSDLSNPLIAGLNTHYVTFDGDIKASAGNGNNSTTGWGVGSTLTWYGEEGHYIDGQLQVAKYLTTLHSDTLNRNLTSKNKAYGIAASLETGKKFVLNRAWSMTPRAQLLYSSVSFNDFTDPYSSRVKQHSDPELTLRLAVEPGYQHTWDRGTQTFNVYSIVGINYSFLASNESTLSDVKLQQRDERTSGTLGLGGQYGWGKNQYAVYGELTGNSTLGHFAESYDTRLLLGMKMAF